MTPTPPETDNFALVWDWTARRMLLACDDSNKRLTIWQLKKDSWTLLAEDEGCAQPLAAVFDWEEGYVRFFSGSMRRSWSFTKKNLKRVEHESPLPIDGADISAAYERTDLELYLCCFGKLYRVESDAFVAIEDLPLIPARMLGEAPVFVSDRDGKCVRFDQDGSQEAALLFDGKSPWALSEGVCDNREFTAVGVSKGPRFGEIKLYDGDEQVQSHRIKDLSATTAIAFHAVDETWVVRAVTRDPRLNESYMTYLLSTSSSDLVPFAPVVIGKEEREPARHAPSPEPESEPVVLPATAESVYLENTADGRKFWRADVHGSGLRVSYGRIGTNGRSKNTEYESREEARGTLHKQAKAKFRRGYRACDPREPSLFWALKGTKGNDVDAMVGPAVRGLSVPWPTCDDCGATMEHCISVFNGPGLELTEHHGLAVFYCDGEGGMCESWIPYGRSNRVLFLSCDSTLTKGPHQGKTRNLKRTKERFEVQPRDDDDDTELFDDTKVGGHPLWIQDPESLACEVCGADMHLVLQIGSDIREFGDAGLAYVFLCPKEHSAATLWQGF